MVLPSGLRLDVEDEPAHADVEVLPDGLEAFNEQMLARASALEAACRLRPRRGADRRRRRGRNLRRLALHPLSLGVGRTARPGNRAKPDGRGRIPRAGARLPFGVCRHVQLSGARLLPEARLRGVRRSRLVAGVQADILAKAPDAWMGFDGERFGRRERDPIGLTVEHAPRRIGFETAPSSKIV